ncbi:hypothetical protein SPOG_05719, partial [Schizosaccharomyces cryophilus OY26]
FTLTFSTVHFNDHSRVCRRSHLTLFEVDPSLAAYVTRDMDMDSGLIASFLWCLSALPFP